MALNRKHTCAIGLGVDGGSLGEQIGNDGGTVHSAASIGHDAAAARCHRCDHQRCQSTGTGHVDVARVRVVALRWSEWKDGRLWCRTGRFVVNVGPPTGVVLVQIGPIDAIHLSQVNALH